MSCWLYYKMDESVLTDEEFDMLCKELLEGFESLPPHIHKHLVKKDALEAGTGYDIEFPLMVKMGAISWWEETHRREWVKGLDKPL